MRIKDRMWTLTFAAALTSACACADAAGLDLTSTLTEAEVAKIKKDDLKAASGRGELLKVIAANGRFFNQEQIEQALVIYVKG